MRKQQKKEEHRLQKQLSQAEYQRKSVRENAQLESGGKRKSDEVEEKHDFYQLPGRLLTCQSRKSKMELFIQQIIGM